jgi:hypothetical protein
MKMKITGYVSEKKLNVKAMSVATLKRGTIETRFIRKEKLAEMEDCGFAYINRPKEYLV